MSNKVWYCANCGYEVNSRGRCHSCGERLTASPHPELESGPDDDEVGYRLDQWDNQTRSRLIQLLISAGLPHRFEEDELVVLAVEEAEVDKLVARASGTLADDDGDPDDGDELHDGRQELAVGDQSSSRALYQAARRLREDPTDMQADAALGEASAALFAVDVLPELDEAQMAAVGRVTRRLLGALGADEALEDEIRSQADVLCRLIAPSAGEEPAAAEAARARARLEAGARQKGRQVELPQSAVTPGGEMAGMTAALGAGAAGGTEGDEALAAQSDLGVGEPASLAAVPNLAQAGEAAEVPAPARAGGQLTSAAQALVGEQEGGAGGPDDAGLDDAGLDDAGLDDAGTVDGDLDEGEEGENDEDEGTGELVYELGEWLPEQRVELSMLLEGAGVAYNWDGTDLTVAEEHEAEVDGLFEQVHGLSDDDDEARYRSIEELFRAVDRLANDPASEERQQLFLGAVGAVEVPTPVGVDDAFWWRVRSQGHSLVAALEATPFRPDEVSRDAALLAEMLHEMV